MKRFLLLSLYLLAFGTAYCTDYSKIDKQSETVPPNFKTPKEIARYLTHKLSSPTDKVRAIYYWITHNISYDVAKLNKTGFYSDNSDLVNEVLASRKGVCSNYSALFKACCDAVGIESYIIDGYIRQNGKLILVGHSWNAVKIAGQFYNIDATWGAGYLAKGKFVQHFNDAEFMIQPTEFIKTHMPFDPVWQFLSKPFSYNEFDTNNFENSEKNSFFNFSDSIKTISTLNPLEKLKRETVRITRNGTRNKLLDEILDYISSNIAIEELKQETIKFNNAVDIFNEGVRTYNKYILAVRNTKIKASNLSQLIDLLNQAKQKNEKALYMALQVKTINLQLNEKLNTFKKSIEKEFSNIDQENSFLLSKKQ